MRALTFLARRFVAGEQIDEAVEAVRALNADGIKATLDNLGEECKSRAQAAAARDEYLLALERIADSGIDCNVSLKLTQFGLNIDGGLARDNLFQVLDQAAALKNFVRIDMEGSAYTQKTLELFYEAFKNYTNVGIVIQAYLKRSEADIAELVYRRASVRLCKGAYKEPASIAFTDKREVDANYDKLAKMLLAAPNPAFATHDDGRIESAVAAAEAAGVKKGRYELQMLYGLRARRWRELAREGHAVRIYVPYGTHWLPYTYRRLRERKENLMFVVKNLFR